MHQFDHDLDELRSWMSEKEVALDSEDQENDLLSVQALIRQHEGLEVHNMDEHWFTISILFYFTMTKVAL